MPFPLDALLAELMLIGLALCIYLIVLEVRGK
jgi:hypothetical protein